MVREQVLTYLPDANEREVVGRVMSQDCRVSDYSGDRARLLSQPVDPVSAIVWDLSPSSTGDFLAVIDAIQERQGGLPRILFRTELNSARAREIVRVATRVSHACVSVRGFDAWPADVEGLASKAPRDGPELEVFGDLIHRSLTKGIEIVIYAILLGKRRVEVRELSKLMRTPMRTLEQRLRAERLPIARVLLAWATALHCAWHVDTQESSLKQIAESAGFNSPEALGNYVARNVGVRPATFRRTGGFPSLLKKFLTLV